MSLDPAMRVLVAKMLELTELRDHLASVRANTEGVELEMRRIARRMRDRQG